MPTPSHQQRELERTRYWQGQLLRARDFNGQIADDLQHRWWHNRALHNAFGVAFGFEFKELRPKKILTGFQFEPGVAYDCYGRSLILQQSRVVPLPANLPSYPAKVTLVVRYRETCDYPQPGQTEGVCISCCDDPLLEETVEFVWRSSAALKPSDGVPLVQVSFNKGRIATRDTSFETLISRPLSRPYLASGTTIAGANTWIITVLNSQAVLLSTEVDTSAAGFTITPCYFARLEAVAAQDLGMDISTVIVTTHVQNPQPNGFTFVVFILIEQNQLFLTELIRLRERTIEVRPEVSVFWLGCESRADAVACLRPDARKSCCS